MGICTDKITALESGRRVPDLRDILRNNLKANISVADEDVWRVLELARPRSTCAKAQTAAAIVKEGVILSIGHNLCAPAGHVYGDIIDSCPRMQITTGSNYELCSPVHSEVMSTLNIRPERPVDEIAKFAGHLKFTREQILGAFTAEELGQLSGGRLYLAGHYWVCEGCAMFLSTVGVDTSEVKLHKVSALELKQRYVRDGLDKAS